MRGIFLKFIIFSMLFFSYTHNLSADMNDEEWVDLFKGFETESLGFFKADSKTAPGGYIHQFNLSQIENSTARSLHELLEQYTPGLNVSYHFFGSLIGQRGIQIDANPKTLFMLEGHSLNTRHHFGYMTALDVPLIGDIKTVEVINGPGAMVYGTGAINGIINSSLKDGAEDQGITLKAEYGFIDDLTKIEVDYGKAFSENNNLYVYFGVLQADGYEPDLTTDALSEAGKTESELADIQELKDLVNGGAYKCKRYKDDNYKLSLNWNYGDFQLVTQFLNINTISLSAQPNLYQETRYNYGLNGAGLIPAYDRDMDYLWGQTHLLIMPKYHMKLDESNNLELQASVFLVDNANYDTERNVFIENFPHNQTTEAEYFIKGTLKNTSIENHSIALGTSISYRDFYHRDPFFRDQLKVSAGSSNYGFVGIAPEGKYFNWVEYSLYAEDVIKLSEKMNLSFGARYDYLKYGKDHVLGNISGGGVGMVTLSDTSLDNFSPRVGFSYMIDETSSMKFSYQNAFRHPDLTNITAKAPDAPSTKIETMDSFEFNFDKKFQDDIHLNINLYYNKFYDTIGWRVRHSGSNTQESEAQEGFTNTPDSYASFGGEIILKYLLSDSLVVSSSYSYSRPEDYSESLQISDFGSVMEVNSDRSKWARYPEHIFKLNADKYFLDKKLLTTLSLAYTSAMQDRYDVDVQKSMSSGRLQVDLAARYNISDQRFIKFYAENITADENTRSPWSVQRSYGIVGWNERTYYLEMGISL